MARGEMPREGEDYKEGSYLTRPQLLEYMVGILDYQAFYFLPEEKDQGALMAISDKEKRREARATRERAVNSILQEIDMLMEHGQIAPDFFHGITNRAEFAAEVIKKMAMEPVKQKEAA